MGLFFFLKKKRKEKKTEFAFIHRKTDGQTGYEGLRKVVRITRAWAFPCISCVATICRSVQNAGKHSFVMSGITLWIFQKYLSMPWLPVESQKPPLLSVIHVEFLHWNNCIHYVQGKRCFDFNSVKFTWNWEQLTKSQLN